MVHDPPNRKKREEDQLAAYIIQTLFDKYDLRASVIHTDTGNECFTETVDHDGRVAYAALPFRRGKLEGYLRGVAINKVLLTNEKWPFVLAQPLHADLAIGVDRKNRHVAFTAVGRKGSYIITYPGKCRFAERILPDEFTKMLTKAVRAYFNSTGEYAKTIVIHRDGRIFDSELQGAYNAIKVLKEEGSVAPNADLTCVEISKHSYTSFRMFETLVNNRGSATRNPMVGQFYVPVPAEFCYARLQNL
jgi:hypothetical protein